MSELAKHLFVVLVDFAFHLGARSINELPDCWEHRWRHAGNEWLVAIHAGTEPRKTSTGAQVPAGAFWIECNGWPAGIVDMAGWTIAAGSVINEEALRAALEAGAQSAEVVRQ